MSLRLTPFSISSISLQFLPHSSRTKTLKVSCIVNMYLSTNIHLLHSILGHPRSSISHTGVYVGILTSNNCSSSNEHDVDRLDRWLPFDFRYATRSSSLSTSSDDEYFDSLPFPFRNFSFRMLPLGDSCLLSEKTPLLLTKVGDISSTSSLAGCSSKDV